MPIALPLILALGALASTCSCISRVSSSVSSSGIGTGTAILTRKSKAFWRDSSSSNGYVPLAGQTLKISSALFLFFEGLTYSCIYLSCPQLFLQQWRPC